MTAASTISRPREVAAYDYLDEHGTVLFQAVRFEPGPDGEKKTFRQRRPDGNGGWVWSLKGVRLVPYRLPELTEAPIDRLVFVAEGEKCVDRLREVEVVATSCPMGAGKWRPEFAEYFRGRYVVVLPDNDEPGRKHAQAVARSLAPVAATLKVLELPGLPAKGDVYDWLETGGDKLKLLGLVQAARAWQEDAKSNSSGTASATTPNLTDRGNALRLVARHGEDVRFCHPWKKWVLWDGSRWRHDETGAVMLMTKNVVAELLRDARRMIVELENETTTNTEVN